MREVDANMAQVLQAVCPATGRLISEVPCTPLERVPQVMQVARRGQGEWSALPVATRLGYIRRMRLAMVERADEIASGVSEDAGKVPVEAVASDLLPVLEACRFLEEHAEKLLRPTRVPTPLLLVGRKSWVEWRPRGVVLIISPWNFPLQLSLVPALYALAAGNAVVVKPSELTPMTGVWIERMAQAAGLPEGVLQVVQGAGDLGAALVRARPDFVFFTGSTRTGRRIQMEAAEQLIPTVLELGGKDPMLVFADAPLERAVEGAVWGGLFNSGQVCVSVERVYVQRSIYDAFVDRLVQVVGTLRQGYDADADLGAMTSPAQVDIVRDHVLDALARGARLRYGPHPDAWPSGPGRFIPPLVLTDVDHSMRIMREETFGPVLPIMPFDTEEDAVALANDCVYGLAASVWTRDKARAERVARRLECGSVVIGDAIVSILNHHLPYGGEKDSGLGRYHGPGGLRLFCRETAVMEQRLPTTREVHWFPYQGKYGPLLDLVRAAYGPRRRWGAFAGAYFRLLRASRAPQPTPKEAGPRWPT